MGLFITAAVLLIAFRLFAAWYNSPQKVGERGERRVAQTLLNGLTDEYCVINDIYLPLPDGTTTQIDHVVVSCYGIFVVETKTYSGWIFGDKDSPQWTQTIYRKKSRFQNPLRQNFRHKCALADCLGISRDWFKDMVVFNGDCKFKTEMPPEIMHRRDAVRYIRNYTNPILKAKEVSDISSAIAEWTSSVGDVSRKNHVANLHKRHSAVSISDSAPPCPYCGKSMVLRKSRKTGRQFYGCTDYPKCHGIVNIT